MSIKILHRSTQVHLCADRKDYMCRLKSALYTPKIILFQCVPKYLHLLSKISSPVHTDSQIHQAALQRVV